MIRETIGGSALGVTAGRIVAHLIGKPEKINEYMAKGAFIGGGAGLLGSFLLSEPMNTVIYKLYQGKRLVYIGICYEDRIERRMNEHSARGLKFGSYSWSSSLTRSKALEKESFLIKKFRPLYNIQHN